MYPFSQNIYQQFLPPVQQEVTKVNGRNGADAYQLAANSSALLLDTSAPIVWLVQTDGAGYKTLIAYDITPHEEEVPKDNFKVLEERISKLEETVNAKSNTTSAKQRKSDAE
jgi:hypothetical protein